MNFERCFHGKEVLSSWVCSSCICIIHSGFYLCIDALISPKDCIGIYAEIYPVRIELVDDLILRFERYVILYRYKTASTIVLRSPPFERYAILYRYKTDQLYSGIAHVFEKCVILYRYKIYTKQFLTCFKHYIWFERYVILIVKI